MLKHITQKVFIVILLILSTQVWAATKYVRCPSLGASQDGGTGYDATHNSGGQCNGSADVPYDGSGTNENCAYNNPMWALSWKDGSYPQKISGGDTLIITGDCEIGHNADGGSFSGTSQDFPWDAYMKPVPSGSDADHKTKIYGSNYATCLGKSDTAKLKGIERVEKVLNMEGSDNVEVKCLTVTDAAQCGEGHPTAVVKCERETFPYGDWAQNGIAAVDSENVFLNYVYADGLANRGVFAARLQNWYWLMGSISGNSFVGWEGDRGDPDDWANGGTITIEGSETNKFKIWWNGCVHNNPESGNPVDESCYSQDQGGNGDGLAINDLNGSLGGANYVLKNVDCSKNVSDCVDLLYKGSPKTVTIEKSSFTHSAGNQIKTAGPTVINDTIASSDCDFFEGKDFAATLNTSGTPTVFNNCRAAGNTISWAAKAAGDTLDIYGSTITGKGDILIMSGGEDGVCDGSERVRVRNSIMLGDNQYPGGVGLTDDYYASGMVSTGNGDGSCGQNEGGLPIDWSSSGAGNIIFNTQSNDTGSGIINSDPLLTDKYNDWSIASGSPARGIRNVSFGSSDDFNGFTRNDAAGALEFNSISGGGGVQNPPSNPFIIKGRVTVMGKVTIGGGGQ